MKLVFLFLLLLAFVLADVFEQSSTFVPEQGKKEVVQENIQGDTYAEENNFNDQKNRNRRRRRRRRRNTRRRFIDVDHSFNDDDLNYDYKEYNYYYD